MSAPDEYKDVPLLLPEAPESGPRPLHYVAPHAPASFNGRRAVLEAVIGADGRVHAVWFASGDREWAAEAAVAVRHWVFEPAVIDGKPTAIRFRITVVCGSA